MAFRLRAMLAKLCAAIRAAVMRAATSGARVRGRPVTTPSAFRCAIRSGLLIGQLRSGDDSIARPSWPRLMPPFAALNCSPSLPETPFQLPRTL